MVKTYFWQHDISATATLSKPSSLFQYGEHLLDECKARLAVDTLQGFASDLMDWQEKFNQVCWVHETRRLVESVVRMSTSKLKIVKL